MDETGLKLSVSPAPRCLLKPLHLPSKLLMGPGPANVPPRVLAASALPMLGHLHPEFIDVMDQVKSGIQYAFQTENPVTLAVSGTGHAAMEAAAVNLVEPGDVVLVTCAGIWGPRFADMAERQGGKVIKIHATPGKSFSHAEIATALVTYRPTLLFVTHGESSSAVCQSIENLGHTCHKYNCLLVVDSVASLGGVPLLMDKWGIDMLYTGSQKVLSAPPGISPVSFSERAWRKVKNRKQPIGSFYLDMTWLANYWGCDGQPRRYHHTGPISSIYALREGLALLAEEGLESCWRRHKDCARALYKGLASLGLNLYVNNISDRLPTVTAVLVPPDVNWKAVSDFIMKNYHVEISGGLGPTVGKVWRIGLMGYNAQPENVRLVLRALREALDHCRGTPTAKL